MEGRAEIRRLHRAEQTPSRAIARHLDISKNTDPAGVPTGSAARRRLVGMEQRPSGHLHVPTGALGHRRCTPFARLATGRPPAARSDGFRAGPSLRHKAKGMKKPQVTASESWG